MFNCSVVSDSLWPHGLQHTRASLTFTISQSLLKLKFIELVMPSNHLILCHPLLLPSIFPNIRSFPVSCLFTSGGHSIGASASVLQMNTQGWLFSGLTGLISLQFKGLSRVFSSTTVWKDQLYSTQPSLWSNSHIHSKTWEHIYQNDKNAELGDRIQEFKI